MESLESAGECITEVGSGNGEEKKGSDELGVVAPHNREQAQAVCFTYL